MNRLTTKPISLFPVLLVNFIGMLGYSIVLPILVFLVEKFGGNAFIYGILGSTYSLFQLIGAPLLGKWSDEIGRKKVLVFSQAGTFAAWVLFIIALVLPREGLLRIDSTLFGSFLITIPLLVLFLARALDGLTGGNVSVANAYLSDISTDENRKANFGKMASSTSLGFILGPTVASLLAVTLFQELLPVVAAALLSLVAIFVISFYLPESRQDLVDSKLSTFSLRKLFQIEHRECYKMKNCPDTGLRAILRLSGIPLLFLIYFLTFLSFSFFYSGFPIYAAQGLGWSSFELGIFLTVSSLIMVLVQGPVLSYLSDKVSDAFLVSLGSFLLLSNFILLPLESIYWIYAANILLSVGNGLMWPSFLSILANKGTPKVQGTIQGYANSMGSMASIFGLIGGGLLFGLLGVTIFYIAASIMFLIFLLSFLLTEKPSPESATLQRT